MKFGQDPLDDFHTARDGRREELRARRREVRERDDGREPLRVRPLRRAQHAPARGGSEVAGFSERAGGAPRRADAGNAREAVEGAPADGRVAVGLGAVEAPLRVAEAAELDDAERRVEAGRAAVDLDAAQRLDGVRRAQGRDGGVEEGVALAVRREDVAAALGVDEEPDREACAAEA